MSWSTDEILSATRGEIVSDRGGRFGEVATDSRRVMAGSVFVALKGERFDAHDFLREAVRRGAGCLIVEKKPDAALVRGSATIIRVRDTLKALGGLARRRRLRAAPTVLAITGSNGKTTAKEMVAAILERATLGGEALGGKVLMTEGNYNNLVGLPLTLLRLTGRERAAVLELGTSRPGEIGELSRIAEPDIGLITSVAPAHLQGLASVWGVAREKGALYRGLKAGGIAIVNVDDPWVSRLGKRFAGAKITYGASGDVRGENWQNMGVRGARFTLRVGRRRQDIRLRLLGRHNLSNALGAAAMAHGFGADLEAIRLGLEAVTPFPMRMAPERWRRLFVLNDAYNANPASMEVALKTLAEVSSGGAKIAVLGDMLELGKESRKRHLELGKTAARLRIDRLYLLGPEAARVKEGAVLGGMDAARVVIGRGHRALARRIAREARPADLLLFKGSRGMRMERVLGALKEIGG